MTLFAEFMTPMAGVTHASRHPGQRTRLSGPAVAAGHLKVGRGRRAGAPISGWSRAAAAVRRTGRRSSGELVHPKQVVGADVDRGDVGEPLHPHRLDAGRGLELGVCDASLAVGDRPVCQLLQSIGSDPADVLRLAGARGEVAGDGGPVDGPFMAVASAACAGKAAAWVVPPAAGDVGEAGNGEAEFLPDLGAGRVLGGPVVVDMAGSGCRAGRWRGRTSGSGPGDR